MTPEPSAPTGKPVLVLCGTGSERDNYLDDPAMVYGPFATDDEAWEWLFDKHATLMNEKVGQGVDAHECELGYWADRDHSTAFLTAPEEA